MTATNERTHIMHVTDEAIAKIQKHVNSTHNSIIAYYDENGDVIDTHESQLGFTSIPKWAKEVVVRYQGHGNRKRVSMERVRADIADHLKGRAEIWGEDE